MFMEMQNQIKKPYNKQLINSNVRSLRENLKPQENGSKTTPQTDGVPLKNRRTRPRRSAQVAS